jgi:ribonuclease HII
VSANEIDAWGLRLALSVAVNRAIENLRVAPTHVLIDGPLNLLDAPAGSAAGVANAPTLRFCDLRHTTIIKGDARSATIAAASVLAKVARDALMVSMHDENVHYGWSSNKGYGTAVHLAAIERHGLHSQHRRSWRLPPLQFPHAV